jgi:hypothetical protein
MKQLVRLCMGALLTVFTFFGVSGVVVAQDKGKDAKAAPAAPAAAPAAKAEKGKSTMKVLIDNNKVLVFERSYKPGDVNDTQEQQSSYRINRTISGGTLERTYADGKKEKIELKTGTVRYLEPAKGPSGKYTTKNIGNTEVVSYVVQLK